MAIHALVPLAVVFSAVNGEIHIVVVKCGGRPGVFAVAVLARSRELSSDVVRVVGCVVVGGMTAKAGIRGVDIISVVALGTVIGYGRMGAV